MTGSLSALGDWYRRRRAATRRVFGINRRNVELVYAHNARRHYPIADDKILCKEILAARGVPVPRTLWTCSALFEVERTLARLRELDHFVVKPANGSGGVGIAVLGARESGGWQTADGGYMSEAELKRHLAGIVFGAYTRQLEDRVLVEERIHPHPTFSELWPGALSDVRVLVLQGRALLAMLRIPTRRSRGRANLHQGGIGVAVDLDSGRTLRAVHDGAVITEHPETGAQLVGRTLPDWPGLRDAAQAAAGAVPLGFLGVDLTVDRERGPLVIEINARPGLEIQNVHSTALGSLLATAGAA